MSGSASYISLAKKSGHFNLLTTTRSAVTRREGHSRAHFTFAYSESSAMQDLRHSKIRGTWIPRLFCSDFVADWRMCRL